MAYDTLLADRIREQLSSLDEVREKEMFGGLAFMVREKMCVGVIRDEMMCRIDPKRQEEALSMPGCREMDFTGRPLKGYVMVDPEALRSRKELAFWIGWCLDYNPKAKSTAKKKKSN